MSLRRSVQLLSRSLLRALAARALTPGSAVSRYRRDPVGLAPDPATAPEPIVQVYGARCERWRGWFGIHTWIAVKPAGATAYTVYDVMARRLRRRPSTLAIEKRTPDTRWFGNMPALLAVKHGHGVDALIERIDRAAREYPYARRYMIWPGPNSNTFTAYVCRAVPELEVHLPPTAIGKDYLGFRMATTAPSGRGFQVSLFGLLGVLASRIEGVEVNLLGLTFGIDPFSPALKLPVVGRLGAARAIRPKAPAGVAARFDGKKLTAGTPRIRVAE